MRRATRSKRINMRASSRAVSFYSLHIAVPLNRGPGIGCWLPTRFILTGGIVGVVICFRVVTRVFLVQEGDYLLGLSRYVHLNPVRGVSLGRSTPSARRKRLRAFRWSSYRGYAGLSAPFPFRARDDGVGRAAGAQASGAIALQAFCREGPVTGGGEPVRSGAVAGGPGRRILCAEAARSGERFAQAAPGNYISTQSCSIH